MEYLFNELRFWDDCPPLMAELDAQDAILDREESLSERYAFQLGEDMGVLRFALDQEELDPQMRLGYQHGMKLPAKVSDVYLRKLLNLRRSAYDRGIPVSSALSREYLKSITVTVCPVSGVNLTQGTLTDTDWSVDRLDNQTGYVPGNLCIMSTRVNKLKDKAEHIDLADAALKCFLRDGPEALTQPLDNGLTVVEALRLASLTAAPYCFARGLGARYMPFAMAPTAWATIDAAVAGIHIGCARSRVEGQAYAKRVHLFKHLGNECWRKSNRLVQALRSALTRGEHPADMWFDGGNTVLLRELTDALMEGPVILPEMNLDQEIEKVMAGFSPIKQFSR